MSVSIVMPVYNGEDFLARAIESVLEQTHENFQFIIIDDGSTDNTLDIIRSYAGRDRRIQLVEQEHAGLPAALNRGIQCADHPLVARMDADDEMAPNRLERQISFLKENPDVSVACSFVRMINRNGGVIGKSKPVVPERDVQHLFPKKCLDIVHSSVMMRKADILAAGGYRDDFYLEDRELWGRLVLHGYKIGVQPEFLLFYRVHSASVTLERLWRNFTWSDFLDYNIDRKLGGLSEISFPDFEKIRARRPFHQKLQSFINNLGQAYYRKSTRYFAEREWSKLACSLPVALFFTPFFTIKRIVLKTNFL